ncbi:MAG: phospholipase D-like domain-containing protein [Halanaeroarchaeum sp.]
MSVRPLLVLLLVGTAVAPPAAADADDGSGDPRPLAIVGVYPNPATDGDVGEYVLLRATRPVDLSGYALADGEDVVALPNRTISGTVAIAGAPRVPVELADRRGVSVPEMLALSNGGETISLRRNDTTVDRLRYPSAPEAEVYDGQEWTPLGATTFAVRRVGSVPVEAFALPDAPTVPLETLRSADRRILLAGYTLTSAPVVDALVAARHRGVAVTVLVEGGPVGGIPRPEPSALDRLTAAGVRVVVSDGERARYAYHHAKYAVVDDRAVVTSENWKPSGIGGHGSRGWGVVIHDSELAAHLATVFAADAGWVDGRPWSAVASSGEPDEPATADYPTRFAPVTATATEVGVLLAPDNAEPALLRLLAGAEESLRIEQVSIDPEGPLVAGAIDAARRGVEVRILLSGTWYVASENRALAENLTALARQESLPLEVRLVEPRSRFDHVHVKGVIVDREQTVVGSINWNPHALRENREVAVLIDDPTVGRYYARLFRADWRGAAWRIHWSTLLVVAGVVLAAGVLAARIDFVEPPETRR